MLRRKPTRIELTTDDVQDYEAIKKKAEENRRKQQEIERNRRRTKSEKKAAAASAAEAEAAAAAAAEKESRRQAGKIVPTRSKPGASRGVLQSACSAEYPFPMSLRSDPDDQAPQRRPPETPWLERPLAPSEPPAPDAAASSVANASHGATDDATFAPSSAFPLHSGPLLEVGFWADPRDSGDQRPNPAGLVDEEWGGTVAALAVALYVRSGFLESFELGYSFCRLGCCCRSDGSKPSKSGVFLNRETLNGAGVVAGAVADGGGHNNEEDAHRSAVSEKGGPARNKFMGCTTLTDGKYVWPEGLAHYVTEHAVRPPEDFVEHALENLQALRKAQQGGRLRWDIDERGVGRPMPLSPGTAVFLRDKTTLGIALPPEPEVRKGAPSPLSDAGSSKEGLCWRLLWWQG